MSLTRRGFAKAAAGVAFVAGFGGVSGAWAQSADTIKVGVLHSLSGTMAISETTLKDVMLMLIEEQNKKGGLLGKKLEAVVVDPASDWPLFAEKARELIAVNKVAAVFGCWTSVSRKSVLPVFKELNSILFYPVQYEGEESERNVFYTGAAPNQQAIPAVDYLMANEKVEALGAGRHRLRLSAHHQQDPRGLSEGQGRRRRRHHDQLHAVRPFRLADDRRPTSRSSARAGKKTAVVSTINGDANVPFYKELGQPGHRGRRTFRSSPSRWARKNSPASTPSPLVGHLAAWNYFQSVDTPENAEFIKTWQAFTKNDKRVTNDPMEAHVIGFNMWVKAVEKAGTTDPDAVIDAHASASRCPNLSGGFSAMMPNHHITKPVLIGEVQENGQFDIVWKTPGLVVGDEWSDYLPELEGPDRRLARAHVLRQLQHRHRQVRRRV